VHIGGAGGPLRFVEADVERWIEESRQTWEPGGRAPVAGRREVETGS
jgi:hypothetical protein